MCQYINVNVMNITDKISIQTVNNWKRLRKLIKEINLEMQNIQMVHRRELRFKK